MAKVQWEKVLTESYVSSKTDLTESEAEKELISAEFAIKSLFQEKEDHEELQAAREIVKDLNAGFSAAIKNEKAKIAFLLEKIENLRNKNSINGG